MKTPFELLSAEIKTQRDTDAPPLHLWHPPLSGDIAIRIDAQGTWYHEEVRITRDSLVRLFASILRREEDGEYYLVAPSEKWRIQVASHPLLVTDIDMAEVAGVRMLRATLNTGKHLLVDGQHPLFLDPEAVTIAVMSLPNGLTALCTRAAWYRLVDLAEQEENGLILRSGNFQLRLPVN